MAARIDPSQLDPRNNLQLYTKSALRNSDAWTDQLIRSEYRRLRDIAQKRLKRLAEAEPGSYAYKHNKGKYPGSRGTSTAEMRKLLPDLAKFIAAKTGSVSGIRAHEKAVLSTLHQHGYTGVNKTNLRAFGEFMEAWRAKNGRSAGSPTAVDKFEFWQDQGVVWDQVEGRFAEFLAQEKKLQDYVQKRHEKGKEVSSADIIAKFESLERQRIARNKRAREARARKKGAL